MPRSTASLRVFDLSLGEMLWSRRTVFLALVVGGPVLIALILRVVDALSVPAMRVNGVQPSAARASSALMIWFLFLRFIVPVLGIFYGTVADGRRGRRQDHHVPVHPADSRGRPC